MATTAIGYPQKYAHYLLNRPPVFTDVLRKVLPRDLTWLGRFKSKPWRNGMTNTNTYHRIHPVRINGLKQWYSKEYLACQGNPCNPPAYTIGLGGYEVNQVGKEIFEVRTDMICFDQIRDVTDAKEHWQFISEEILSPTNLYIQNAYFQRKAAELAGVRWVANAAMSSFNFSLVLDADGNYAFMDCNVPPGGVFKLTPQHLQRRVWPRLANGAGRGGSIIDSLANKHEVIIDLETIWDLDRQTTTGATNLAQYWRYTDFGTANNYWSYNIRGQLGDFVLVPDAEQLRFYYVGPSGGAYPHRYRIVRPYMNEAIVTGAGRRVVPNPDYERATFAFGFITHPDALTFIPAEAEPISKDMPFLVRGLAGQWRFFIPKDIQNYRENQGFFYASFEQAMRADNPELLEVFFYKRERQVAPTVDIHSSNVQTDYPAQDYSDTDVLCTLGPWGVGLSCPSGQSLTIQPNSILLFGVPVVHTRFQGATFAALATSLQGHSTFNTWGTWAAEQGGLVLKNPKFTDVFVPIECAPTA